MTEHPGFYKIDGDPKSGSARVGVLAVWQQEESANNQ
jgi:hypothetical protein